MTGDPALYTRFPEEGRFYAMREPLCLGCIKYAGDTTDMCGVTLNLWTPFSNEEEVIYMGLKTTLAEYLWFEAKYQRGNREGFLGTKLDMFIGDVWLSKKINRLWFVGPETDHQFLQILASFEVEEADVYRSVLYQPGAERRLRCSGTKTSFQRIMEDDT